MPSKLLPLLFVVALPDLAVAQSRPSLDTLPRVRLQLKNAVIVIGRLRETEFEVATDFGRLKVPVINIRNITPSKTSWTKAGVPELSIATTKFPIVGSLLIKSLSVDTPYGRLEIPLEDVTSLQSYGVGTVAIAKTNRKPGGSTTAAASVNGKYARLLRKFTIPEDRATYGEFRDYGFFSGKTYRGHTDLPAGYWVYLHPNWYIWGDLRK